MPRTPPPRTPAPARREPKQRQRRWPVFLGLLALLAAIAVVAVLLLQPDDGGGGGSNVQPIDRGDVQQQIDGLRDFIQEHSR